MGQVSGSGPADHSSFARIRKQDNVDPKPVKRGATETSSAQMARADGTVRHVRAEEGADPRVQGQLQQAATTQREALERAPARMKKSVRFGADVKPPEDMPSPTRMGMTITREQVLESVDILSEGLRTLDEDYSQLKDQLSDLDDRISAKERELEDAEVDFRTSGKKHVYIDDAKGIFSKAERETQLGNLARLGRKTDMLQGEVSELKAERRVIQRKMARNEDAFFEMRTELKEARSQLRDVVDREEARIAAGESDAASAHDKAMLDRGANVLESGNDLLAASKEVLAGAKERFTEIQARRAAIRPAAVPTEEVRAGGAPSMPSRGSKPTLPSKDELLARSRAARQAPAPVNEARAEVAPAPGDEARAEVAPAPGDEARAEVAPAPQYETISLEGNDAPPAAQTETIELGEASRAAEEAEPVETPRFTPPVRSAEQVKFARKFADGNAKALKQFEMAYDSFIHGEQSKILDRMNLFLNAADRAVVIEGTEVTNEIKEFNRFLQKEGALSKLARLSDMLFELVLTEPDPKIRGNIKKQLAKMAKSYVDKGDFEAALPISTVLTNAFLEQTEKIDSKGRRKNESVEKLGSEYKNTVNELETLFDPGSNNKNLFDAYNRTENGVIPMAYLSKMFEFADQNEHLYGLDNSVMNVHKFCKGVRRAVKNRATQENLGQNDAKSLYFDDIGNTKQDKDLAYNLKEALKK